MSGEEGLEREFRQSPVTVLNTTNIYSHLAEYIHDDTYASV